MQDLPSGTVTFLFTDIEGSTKLWERHPDAMRLALARHDALLHVAIENHNGYVFKTVGDAFCAAFPTVLDALNAALAAQRALLAQPWPAETVLRVRMALHTGTAEFRDNDYFGQTLNRVARLLAIGHGGQTLISQTTRQFLPADTPLEDKGTHRLKDLQHPEHVWQLSAPDLPSEFPPLHSLNPQRHNLPIQSTSFIGRETEMEEVKARLSSVRLLTLTGTGGCGKTRLALQVGADLVEAYADGVWLVELAALTEPALVAQTVATVLGLREEPGRSLSETLTDHLRSKSLLLLLDNCEHLVDACAQLAAGLLRSCPQVQILATSREQLNVGGEQSWRVPSLLSPDPNALPAGEKDLSAVVMEYDAARLFVERAAMQRAEFRLSGQNVRSVATICHRLDGIPLALELAAARVRVLTVEEITQRLDDRFRLLTGGSRTALPRQQTLRALLDWSYELLTTQERTLLHRLAVFAGGWGLAAAEAVGSDFGLPDTSASASLQNPKSEIQNEEVLDLLTSLVDKSLVVVEEREGETWYRLLETVREYSRERLEASGEEASVRDRHQAWLLRLAEEAEPQLLGPEQGKWLDRLETEHDNLRSAIEWSLKAKAGSEGEEAGLRLCGALWRFWNTRGYPTEGREWCRAALARETGVSERAAVRAKALNGAGNMAYAQGDYVAAQTLYKEALTARREISDRQGIAGTLLSLGNLAYSQGDYVAAQALYEEALAMYREIGDRQGIANTLGNLGTVAYSQSDYVAAQALYEESLATKREIGDRQGIANTLGNLGNVAYAQGDYVAAQALHEESLVIEREIGNRWGIAITLNNLGNVASNRGNRVAARTLYEESLAIKREIGDRRGIAAALGNLGIEASLQGDYVAARTLYEESLAIKWEIGDRSGITEALEGFAALAAAEAPRKSSLADPTSALDDESARYAARAARLWGAAQALREAIGAPLPPNDQEEYEGDVAAARAILGEAEFAAVWEEGRALTLEQAIEYALSQVE